MPLKAALLQVIEGHQGAVYGLVVTPDGHLISAGGDGLIVQWTAQPAGDRGLPYSAQGVALMQVGSPVFDLHCAPTGALAAATGNGEVLRGHVGGAWTRDKVHEGGAFRVTEAASGGADGRWVARTGALRIAVPGRIRCAWTPKGEVEGAEWMGTSEGRIHRVSGDPDTPGLEAHEGAVRDMADWPGKSAMVSVGGDGRMVLWKRLTDGGLERLLTLDAHKGAIYRVVPNPDGRWVATCSRDRTFALWDADTLAPLLRVGRPHHPAHLRSVNALVWAGNDRVVTAGDDGRILVWSIAQ